MRRRFGFAALIAGNKGLAGRLAEMGIARAIGGVFSEAVSRSLARMLRRVAREIWARIAFMRDPIGYHRKQGVRIGARVELVAGTIHSFGGEPYLVTIGDDVTISHGVDFITHDGGLRVVRDRHPDAYYYAPITVGDRAFIGARATILPGVSIGARAVVGAGAVVADTVAPGMVVAGVPARPIKTVDEYALARRADWIDTSGLDADAKERLLRQFLAQTHSASSRGCPGATLASGDRDC